MKNSIEILNELKTISPFLAGLEKVNVYEVPMGYFDKLEERITDFAISNSINESIFNKTNVQNVPEGYFDSLSTNILAKIKGVYLETANEELQNLSPVLFSLKENVFKVPEGYFDSLGTNILAEIKKSYPETENEELRNLPPVFLSLKKKNIFKVPEGHFDSLSTNILAKIKRLHPETANEELQNLSPVLRSLKKENVFKVPEGYFENLAGTVTSKIKPATAKVIVMKPRNVWLKIAAAAVVTGAIAISSLNIFNHSSSNQDNTGTMVAATSTVMPAYIKESFQFKTEQEVDAGIAKLSDDDIIKYLEKNGNVTDNELLMKNTDVSELPSQTDYLMDENTLNTYLDKIDEKSKTN